MPSLSSHEVHVELSPSPDPPRLQSTAGPSRLTTAVPRTRSMTSTGSRAACEGDLYVVNAMNGERFHLTVTLQGPFHPLTVVTHASLQRAVRDILLPHSSLDPPPTLLLDGMPLDESTTETLPNNAVIVVHRGESAEVVASVLQHRRRSRTSSQPADGGITVVEMLSCDSLALSATTPSEREMSLHSCRPRTCGAAATAERPLTRTTPTHNTSPKEEAKPSVTAAAAAAAAATTAVKPSGIAPSARLPPRRARSSAAANVFASSGTGKSAQPLETTPNPVPPSPSITTTASLSTLTRTHDSEPARRAPAPSAAATTSGSSASIATDNVPTATPGAAPSAPSPLTSRSFRSTPSDEDAAYVVRTPAVVVPVKPLDALQDTGVSAATVSAPSSIVPMPSMQSMYGTQTSMDTDSVVDHTPRTSASAMKSPTQPPPPPQKPPATMLAVTIPPHNTRDASNTNRGNADGVWDRGKLPPVTVYLPSSLPQPASSPSQPSTAFTSPAFSQKSPPSAHPRSPPESQRQLTFLCEAGADETSAAPAATASSPSTPTRNYGTASGGAGGDCTASATALDGSTALFCTPVQTPTPTLHSTSGASALILQTAAEDAPPPLPPHDCPATATTARREKQRYCVDARQTAYATQRDAIVSAAAAEQQRLLSRLQQHCQKLEKEKKELLMTRLVELRAQESAARLRVLRAAQEDAVAQEMDAVRARLGDCRDELLNHWLRVVHTHTDRHYAVSQELLKELEAEGERLTLQYLSSIAGYHTQRARLQALQQQRALKEAEVARLKWEAHVRRCTAEERQGCLRVVARIRPPLRRAWLPEWVLSSPEAADFDRGYAVRVPPVDAAPTTKHSNGTARGTNTASSAADPSACVEVMNPSRNLRRRYTFSAAYDDAVNSRDGTAQQRLFKEQLQPLLEHMCRTGQRVAVLAFGAVGSGKSYTLLGPSAEPPPPPKPASTWMKKRLAKSEPAAATATQCCSCHSDSASFFSSDDDESDAGHVSRNGDNFTQLKQGTHPAAASDQQQQQQQGVAEVWAPPRRGITRCLEPAEEEVEARVLRSLAEAEEEDRQQRSRECQARDERRWQAQADIVPEDGLLPRAVAWLTAHLRANDANRGKSAAGEPVVESVIFSMYEVYNDHIYDLLPAPSAGTPSPQNGEDGDEVEQQGKRHVRSDPSTWPRWNAGWLPAPHIKNSNPEKLTELQLELVPARRDSKEAAATLSQLQQPAPQPQWRVRASEVEVRSPADVLQAVQLGLQRRRSAATLRNTRSSRSHLFLRFRVEVERPTMPEKASAAAARASPSPALAASLDAAPPNASKLKGYSFLCAALQPASPTTPSPAVVASAPTCVTELLFTDFAGSEWVELGGATGDALREAQYINASLSAVADVLTALARANPCRDDGNAENGKSDALGGAQASGRGRKTAAPSAASSSLVERWGALVSRPGVSLTRSTPVILQPRFSKLAGGRYRVPPPSSSPVSSGGGDEQRGLPLRRRVLALMDAYVAGQSAAQWWRSWRAPSPYIPFRTCKTTQLLQSVMGLPCKTLVLACVRPCTVAEVVLPASLQDGKGKRARELALALFDHQAPVMLAETQSTLIFADRVNTAAHSSGDAADAASRA